MTGNGVFCSQCSGNHGVIYDFKQCSKQVFISNFKKIQMCQKFVKRLSHPRFSIHVVKMTLNQAFDNYKDTIGASLIPRVLTFLNFLCTL